MRRAAPNGPGPSERPRRSGCPAGFGASRVGASRVGASRTGASRTSPSIARFFCALFLLALLAPRPARAAQPAWSIEGDETPPALFVGLEVEVSVRLKNRGAEPWLPSRDDRLSYHWRSLDGELLIRDGLRTPLPEVVAPGEQIELKAHLAPPPEPGRYRLEWAMVRENAYWFPPPEGGPEFIEVLVELGTLDWATVDFEAPTHLAAGELAQVPVRLKNRGEVPWEGERGDALAYHWWSEEGELVIRDGRRTPLPAVAPGETVALDLALQAPSHRGPGARRFCVTLEPLRERVQWFGPSARGPEDPGFACAWVEPDLLQWDLIDDQTPARLHSDAGELSVPVVLRNAGGEPWPAADFFSYRWRRLDAAGHPSSAPVEGLRTPLPGEVLPGEVVAVDARLAAPPLPGRYRLEWGLVREGERWYPPPPSLGAAQRELEILSPRLAWGLLAAEAPAGPLGAWINRTREVEVELVNLGSATWSEAAGDHLAYRWLDPNGELVEADGMRSSLPGPVAPGESVIVRARVRGPERPGTYGLQWQMVREHVRWYGPPRRLGQDLRWSGRDLPLARARWLSGLLILALAGLSVFGALALRLWPPRRTWARAATELAPLVWAALAIAALVAAVHDLSGIEAWPGASWTAASGAWLLVAIPAVARGRWRAALAAALVCALAALALGDLVYLHYFGSIVPVVALTASHHLGEVGDSAVAELERAWGWLAVLPAAGLLGAALWPRRSHEADEDAPEPEPGGATTETEAPIKKDTSAQPTLPRWRRALGARGGTQRGSWRRVFRRGREAKTQLYRAYCKFWRQSPRRKDQARCRVGFHHGLLASPRLRAAAICLLLASPALVRLGAALAGSLGQRVFSEQAMVGRFGYVNAHLFDLARSLRERSRRGRALDAEALAAVEAELERSANAASEAAAIAEHHPSRPRPFGAAAGDNLLLIQVEAAQSWVIGLEVRGQEITPFLNRLRGSADWYPYFVDQTNQGKTSDAEYAVLNSQHPLGEGAVCFLRADNHFHSLAHVLSETAGYTTLSAHPYKRGFWNRAVLHPRYGFERSLFRRELGEGTTTGWGLADGPFFARILPELEALPQPWFAFLITLSLHHPYEHWPRSLEALDLGRLEGTRVGNYLEAMHYFDRSLAELLAGLEDAGLLDHTLVALYGDHDARFELDAYPEVVELASGGATWDPALFHRLERVPAFVRLPEHARKRGAGGAVEVVGGHIDLAPTLLHHLGVERPHDFIGRPLLPGSEDQDFAAYPDASAYGPARMFVAEGPGIPREGGCFGFGPAAEDAASHPRSECEDLAERSATQLSVSRQIVDHDLARSLAQSP